MPWVDAPWHPPPQSGGGGPGEAGGGGDPRRSLAVAPSTGFAGPPPPFHGGGRAPLISASGHRTWPSPKSIVATQRRRSRLRRVVLAAAACFGLALGRRARQRRLRRLADRSRSCRRCPTRRRSPTSTIVVDRDGRLLRPFTIADGRWRLPVTKDEVDPRFLDMLIGYEDQRFYEHGGVDSERAAPRRRAVRACRRPHRLRRLDAHHAGGAADRRRRHAERRRQAPPDRASRGRSRRASARTRSSTST